MKKVIGWILLFLPIASILAVMFVAISIHFGIAKALLAFLGLCAFFSCIFLGAYRIV
jgi:hypothetical protein